ncbi:MAG: alpha-galactosidase, partial [Lachnospiraceae bacterium]|nr:alpha-galactosidase [Lachnospiraceae bacterium]
MINSSLTQPNKLESNDYRYDFFNDGKVLFAKRKGRLPAMGWNSWNAFGSGNNEELTRITAEKFIELGLDKLGYEYLVLDDGCYKSERVDGRLSNEEQKVPGGFRALADFIHSKGLKFGMYNDIGTNLCAGAAVGTCGHEQEDAASYIEWDVDFLKVDNCYYLWDNATFSNGENAKYVYAPAIGRVEIVRGSSDDDAGDRQFRLEFVPGKSMYTTGDGVHTELIEDRLYFTNIGTFDGTGPARTPVGVQSGEVVIEAEVPEDGEYELVIDHINGVEPGRGSWLQIAVDDAYIFDDILDSDRIKLDLKSGIRKIRFMNHRRQENTLMSYAKLLEGLKEAAPGRDLVYSLCEWGKTQPQNWGRKLADSWRILNDITFSVGSDGNPGNANWTSDYTN